LRTKYVIFVTLVALASGTCGAAQKNKATEKGKGALSCEEQKRRYRESEACFAKYRQTSKPDKQGRTHSSLRPGAYRKCQEMKEPQCE
jgi:hypothetical protein